MTQLLFETQDKYETLRRAGHVGHDAVPQVAEGPRAHQRTGGGVLGGAHDVGDAKIGNVGFVFLVEQDVAGF